MFGVRRKGVCVEWLFGEFRCVLNGGGMGGWWMWDVFLREGYLSCGFLMVVVEGCNYED